MSRDRFAQLHRWITFDDSASRDQRRNETNPPDKLVAFRDIADMFAVRFRTLYNPNYHVTVDEQLVGFRGRTGMRVYMPDKPDKYVKNIVFIYNIYKNICFI